MKISFLQVLRSPVNRRSSILHPVLDLMLKYGKGKT
jgi:hypothetical protein